MVRPNLQPAHVLAYAATFLVVGCAQQNSSADFSRYTSSTAAPRVNDIYQNRTPEVVRYDRYTLVNTRPADAQRDPLNQIIDITMPASIVKSVGDGFRYLLLESGYSLCPSSSPVFSELLSRPLPAVQRTVGPVRLSEALQIVAGQAWRLRVDEVNREVCFVLRDEYRSFAVSTPVVATAKTVSAPASATAAATAQSQQKFLLKPDSQPLPPLPSAKTLSTQPTVAVAAASSTSATAAPTPVKSFDLPPYNPNQKISANSASKAVPKVSGGTPHVPTTALPPAPAAQPQPVRQTVTSVTGPTWKADVGSTLKETLTKWATQAKCDTNGGNWVVIWPVAVDYRIDAPLSFHGNFESVLVQIFDLYRRAEKPLFAEASRMQCLVSVSDTPVSGAGR
ncbi:PFGI-1 class ICE element type IV pilus protein PilL2 [Dickeya fangzhongdai]|uniref:PFGI-1 class ICE element type IV pilus protein PilL2 n=1 Tax=Dickeya fangzhongdai TaxID=1778540 RepID=UPI002B25C255|nr:TcpQ domain-containing protein [Dickeya fangzhongdai]WOY03077.1 TcpQ domain-containing protein [Dickeya fangzhongdai]